MLITFILTCNPSYTVLITLRTKSHDPFGQAALRWPSSSTRYAGAEPQGPRDPQKKVSYRIPIWDFNLNPFRLTPALVVTLMVGLSCGFLIMGLWFNLGQHNITETLLLPIYPYRNKNAVLSRYPTAYVFGSQCKSRAKSFKTQV